MKDMKAFDFLTRMSTLSYYRYIQVAKMLLRNERVLALMESLIDDDVRSKRLAISHLNDTELYTVTTKELQILIKAARRFVENPGKPSPFHAPKLCTSSKMFLWERRAMIVDYRTDSTLHFVELFEHDYVSYAHEKDSPAADGFKLHALAQL